MTTNVQPGTGQAAILYFAVHDRDYPRNERIRSFLTEELRVRMAVIPVPKSRSIVRRYLGLAGQLLACRDKPDLVILSEFAVIYAPLAWLYSRLRRIPLVVDFFVGLVETEVGDAHVTAATSARAKVLAALDRLAVRSAQFCLTDTDVRAKLFSQQYHRPFYSLPVGAPAWAREGKSSTSGSQPLRLLYYGSYLPLHGLESLVLALAIMPEGSFEATFIGQGPGREAIEHLVSAKRLGDRIEFLGYLQPSELVEVIADHDVVVGVLGESTKALTVIANKVWQALSLGRTVLTRRSDALCEIGNIVANQLILVEDSQPASIADALSAVASSKATGDPSVSSTSGSGQRLENYVVARYKAVFAAEEVAAAFGGAR